jgi:hypothetical protein
MLPQQQPLTIRTAAISADVTSVDFQTQEVHSHKGHLADKTAVQQDALRVRKPAPPTPQKATATKVTRIDFKPRKSTATKVTWHIRAATAEEVRSTGTDSNHQPLLFLFGEWAQQQGRKVSND